MSVRRFDPYYKDDFGFRVMANMGESSTGDWVDYSDYATLEAENQRLRNLLAAASLALYQTKPETWQEQVRASLSKSFMQAHAGLDALEQKQVKEVIERIEKEKS